MTIVQSGPGDETLNGTNGDDTYIYEYGDGHDVIVEAGVGNDVDTLRMVGIDPWRVTFARDPDALTDLDLRDDLLVLIDGGEGGSIRLFDQRDRLAWRTVDQMVFDDGTVWHRSEFVLRTPQIVPTTYVDGTSGNDVISLDPTWHPETYQIIDGGAGDDTLNGGWGSDVFIYRAGSGDDVIDEGGGYDARDADVVRFDGLTLDDVRFERSPTYPDSFDLTIAIRATGERLLVNNAFSFYAQAIERFVFDGDVVLTIADILPLVVAPGSETIIGTEGAETLDGGAGDDTLIGLGGDDYLRGGAGDDHFVFGPDFGHDTIGDFTAGPTSGDVIAFSTQLFADFAAVQAAMTQIGGDTLIARDAAHHIALSGVRMSDLDAGDFLFTTPPPSILLQGTSAHEALRGGAGDETIIGGGGDDHLRGGGGDDLFVFGPGFGHDTIGDFSAGPAGGDVIEFSAQLFADYDALRAAMTQVGANVLISTGGSEALALTYVPLASLDAGDFRFV